MVTGLGMSKGMTVEEDLRPVVLFRVFKRPIETAATLEALLRRPPRDFYIWIDAPRNSDEEPLVRAVRDVVYSIPKGDYRVFIRENDVNRGMTRAFKEACDWFFSHVPEGVIVEDDCVPGSDFLEFCGNLLRKYREDERVLAITGDNSAGGKVLGSNSYAFVHDFSVWGWATWRRVWQRYDHDLHEWPRYRRNKDLLATYWPNRLQRQKWIDRFDRVYSQEPGLQESTWRFMFVGLKTQGSVALPRVNLVSNIGTNVSTATGGARSARRAEATTGSILPIKHPRSTRVSWWTNRTLFYSPKRHNRQMTWWFPLKKRLRRSARQVLNRSKLFLKN